MSDTDSTSTPSASSEPGEIQAVSRAAQILSLFGPDDPDLSSTDIADRLGFNRTTAYRYCTSLVTAGLLERGVDAGRYIPGRLLLQLGAFAIGRRRVVNLAPRHLQALSREAGATAVLSLWGSSGPIVTRTEEFSSSVVVVSVRVGGHLPVNTAQCKVFLAFLQDQLAMTRFVANLPQAQRDQLVADVAQVRAAGHCSASSTPGVVALAAPVFDEYGICATLAVVGTDNVLSSAGDALELDVLVATARELTKELGGHYLPDEPR